MPLDFPALRLAHDRIRPHIRRTPVPTSAVAAMRALWEALRSVVEPSGAVAFAAIHAGRINARGQRVGVILTGGKVDLDALPWLPTPSR